VFYKDLGVCENAPDEADKVDRPRLVVRTSVVFNAAQVEGAAEPAPLLDTNPSLPEFERFVAATGAAIRFGENRAAYSPSTDTIGMPPRNHFRSLPGYAATLAHELIHWTGAKHRLDRDLTARFGSRRYAGEELVAELGAAFVLAELELAREPHPQHAAYMASWLPLLKADPRAIFTAAAHATRAAAALQAFQTTHHLQDA